MNFPFSLLNFITKNPTPWHVGASLLEEMKSVKMTPLSFQEMDTLQLGERYCLYRDGLVVVVVMPQNKVTAANIYTCHIDAPCLKVKEQGFFVQNGLVMLASEIYGSPILASWVGRAVRITGTVWGKDTDGVDQIWQLPYDAKILGTIPHLAIHLDRTVNESGFMIPKQNMNVVVGVEGAVTSLEELLLPVIPSLAKIHFHDLFVVPDVSSETIAHNNSLIHAPRLDNLLSAWALMEGAKTAVCSSDGVAKVYLFCNNEEIGSESSMGAYSSLILDCMDLIYDAHSIAEKIRCKSRSLIISADVGHAIHPSYVDKHDPQHPVMLGKGVVIKLNNQQRYGFHPKLLNAFINMCEKENIARQLFYSRNDIPCGSTVGPILSTRLGIDAIDIGVPIIGMHASTEVASLYDVQEFKKLIDVVGNSFCG